MQQHQSSVMAFAAICQAAEMVKEIARYNRADEQQLDTMVRSLTYINASTPLEIYGSLGNLKKGYEVMINQLGNEPKKDVEVTRYVLGTIALERQLAKRPKSMGQLSERIDDLNRQLEHFELLDPSTLEKVAAIYSDIISPLGRSIEVVGEQQFLTVSSNVNKVRALLLCAVRAAVLWRQMGGKRRHLMFKRHALVEVAEQDLRRI